MVHLAVASMWLQRRGSHEGRAIIVKTNIVTAYRAIDRYMQVSGEPSIT